ncbi:MAG: HU family DNA-binding protein [Gammaproteobacteria bacterium]|nr:HU family DNA-binding protein [Gammaproteobacteria bacterium]
MAIKKKAAKKKAAKKKVVTSAAKKRVTAIKEPMTKSALYAAIAEKTDLKKKDVDAVFGALSEIIEGHLKKGGAGVFTMPGLLKMKVVRKPATRARKGINPFTGEETTFKAKPARNIVKIAPLKGAKEMVA